VDRLAAMETFVRVVETGSFSAAARVLNVGQPAVSKTIAQLEARLNVRLLMRSTRGLAPTEPGRVFMIVRGALSRRPTRRNRSCGNIHTVETTDRMCHGPDASAFA
jgi:hypothetical protein